MQRKPLLISVNNRSLKAFILGSLHREQVLILTEWRGSLTDLAAHIRDLRLGHEATCRLLMKSADRVQRRINRLLYTADNPDTQET